MFQRILLAVDGSEHSEKAVPVTIDLAKMYGASVVVVHVREHESTWVADLDVETPTEAAELVDRIVRQLKDAEVDGIGEIHRVRSGLVSHDILETARELDAQLIIMGTRGLTDLSSLLVGSVAHKVLHLATCPVLLVR